MGIDSADTNQPSNGEICMGKSYLLPNNPARQQYRYTSVPIEAACNNRGGQCTNRGGPVPIEAAKVPIEAACTNRGGTTGDSPWSSAQIQNLKISRFGGIKRGIDNILKTEINKFVQLGENLGIRQVKPRNIAWVQVKIWLKTSRIQRVYRIADKTILTGSEL